MSKKFLVVIVVITFALSLGIGVSIGFAAKGPDEIILNEGGNKPAKFPHAVHQEKNDCATCHHTNVDGIRTPVEGESVTEDGSAKCDNCHKEGFQNEELAKWKDIGHALCKDCHKKNNGPTNCTDCHVKK